MEDVYGGEVLEEDCNQSGGEGRVLEIERGRGREGRKEGKRWKRELTEDSSQQERQRFGSLLDEDTSTDPADGSER